MTTEDICPFARFVRKLTTDRDYDWYRPYDARLFYTLDGEGVIDADGTAYDMTAGTLLLIAPGALYRLRSARGRRAVYLAVNFDYTQAGRKRMMPIRSAKPEAFEAANMTERARFEDEVRLNGALCLTEMFALRAPLETMEREYRCRLTGWRVKVNALLGGVLADCLRGGQAGGGEERLDAVIDYIHEDLGRPMTNRLLAARFGYHPNYLSSLFARAAGVPLHQYLIRTRLEAAAQLLLETDAPIAEIARRTGFDGAASFSAAFRKHWGCTPGQYRG